MINEHTQYSYVNLKFSLVKCNVAVATLKKLKNTPIIQDSLQNNVKHEQLSRHQNNNA